MFSSFNVVLGIVLFLSSANLYAQSVWMPPARGNSLGIEFMKPVFDKNFNFGFFSALVSLSGKFALSDKTDILFELPIARGSVDIDEEFFQWNDSETAIGNLYVGFVFKSERTGFKTELGIRLPTAPDNKPIAATVGWNTDLDRMETFLSDIWVAHARLEQFQVAENSNLASRVRIGGSLWLDTGEFSEDDIEGWLDYLGQLGYVDAQKSFMVGVSGRMLLTGGGSLSDKTVHHLGLFFTWHADNLHPGLSAKFPLDDDWGELVDYVIGVNLIVDLE